jgi:hypothetical protein
MDRGDEAINGWMIGQKLVKVKGKVGRRGIRPVKRR